MDGLRIAMRAIAANRLRSALTALGLIIGVSSVIVLIAVGQGAQKGVTAQIQGLGTDLMFVQPGQSSARQATGGAREQAATLTSQDGDAIAAAGIPGISGVDSQISTPAQAIVGAQNTTTTLIGTTPNYLDVRGGTLASGSFFTDTDVTTKSLNAVLGATVASQLFPGQDPLNQFVRIALAGGRITFNYHVIGVMAPKGGTGQDDTYIYIPVTSITGRIGFIRNATGQTPVRQIDIKTTPNADQTLIKQEISDLLLQRHAVSAPDFLIQSQNDLLGAASQVSTTLSILLGSVAGISLIVGGIGVMNIMLVSVTERTREIGIRRAVGAQANDIVKQFVTEALTLCSVGGIVGIVIGVGSALLVNNRTIAGSTMSTLVQPWSVGVAFAVAVFVGLISGSYPAYRATAVDPITALRNE
jgi:putative ABC transport system permease protein